MNEKSIKIGDIVYRITFVNNKMHIESCIIVNIKAALGKAEYACLSKQVLLSQEITISEITLLPIEKNEADNFSLSEEPVFITDFTTIFKTEDDAKKYLWNEIARVDKSHYCDGSEEE